MKKTMFKIWTMLAATLFIYTAGAQVSTYERTPGYYTFGINGGLSYQQGDIPTTLEGYGLGFTLAKNLYYQPGSPIAFDIRGRAMYAQTKGQDYFRSYGIADNEAVNGSFNLDYTKESGGPGFVFQNNKTDQVELGLEGVIHFNSLRERTNVNLSLFGGIGLDWYNVKTDQADRNGTYANQYLGIDTLASVSYIKNELKNAILDGRYETAASGFEGKAGKLGIMPSLGVELGYQFSPRFSMGLGHKVTFTNTDLFDGHQWKNNNNLTAEDDIHHYTNLHMRWIIDDNSKKLREPLVDITNPSISPHKTRNSTFDLRAKIEHVNSSMDVELLVNGYNETFNFRKGKLSSILRLQPGNNEVVVTGRNEAGTARDVVNIFFEDQIDSNPDYKYPVVDITNPSYDDFRTNDQRFNLRASVRNIFRSEQVQLTVNGRNYNNFDLRNETITAVLDLNAGRNEVRIEARNSDGFDSDETTIIYEVENFNRPPSVEITSPSVDPYKTTSRIVSIEARLYNIDSKQDIRYTVDGYDVYDYEFSNGILRATVNVDKYKTIVAITGSNESGQDSDNVTILWIEEEESIDKPVVTITSVSQPTVDPYNTENCQSTVIATVLNVQDRNNINVYINGSYFTDYDFNSNTQVLRAVVKLAQGSNEIKIEASNAAGSDMDIATAQGCNIEQEESIDAPVVTITSTSQPTIDPFNIDNCRSTVIATILNIEDRSDIEVYVNGQLFTDFDFNRNTQVLRAVVRLVQGTNEIRVKATNAAGSDQDITTTQGCSVEQEDEKTPPTVTITTPSQTNQKVGQAKSTVKATITNISNKSDITLRVNGDVSNNFRFNKFTNEFSSTVTLNKGPNKITIKATNQDGSDLDQTTIIYESIIPVRLPKVVIRKPANNSSTPNVEANLEAKVLNVGTKSGIEVFLNGNRITNFSFDKRRNEVKANLNLQEGLNMIRVIGTNTAGSDESSVQVRLTQPKRTPPIVKIDRPSNGKTVTTDKVNLSANIKNVTSKRGVVVQVNGRPVYDFNYFKGEVEATISLRAGKNTIIVKASNADGTDQDQVNVDYKMPTPKPPTVDITKPSNNATVTKGITNVRASIKNVSKKNQISFTVNGKLTDDFRYSRGQVQANVNLKNGKNTVIIKATNSDGSDEDRVIITFKVTPQIPKPIVSFKAPRKTGTTVRSEKYKVVATVKNVKDKKDITLKLNGKNVSNFSFKPKSGEVSATVNLRQGKNAILVEGRNAVGNNDAKTSITYKRMVSKKNPPIVSIVSVSTPTVDPFNPNTGRSTVLAKINHVSTKEQITFTHNGKKITNFSFNASSGNLQAVIVLKKGKNTFEIKASNKDGSDSAKQTITFGDSTGSTSPRNGNGSSNGRRSRKG